jgi:hypothetical protein
MQIQTIKGLLDRSELVVKDVVVEEDNARITATEWYLADELVRRDVNVNVLRGLSFEGSQSVI